MNQKATTPHNLSLHHIGKYKKVKGFRAVIFSAPHGWGKTIHAEILKKEHGCTSVVDEWSIRNRLTNGAIHLTNEYFEPSPHDRRIIVISKGW